jgi:Domain of unknown function (DUF4413)
LNIILAIASFFDPRSKMGLIELYYSRIYKNDSVSEMIEFSKVLRELYGEYSLKYRVSSQSGEQFMPGDASSNVSDDNDGVDKFS